MRSRTAGGLLAGAALWVGYGLLMQALPVIAANVLVLSAAAWASTRPAGDPM